MDPVEYKVLQDHDPKSQTPADRQVEKAVRLEGQTDEGFRKPVQGTAGFMEGAVCFKADGEDRGLEAAWSFAMPVVGGKTDQISIDASTGGASGQTVADYHVTPAKGPDAAGQLQPATGLERMRYSRTGEPGTVFNLAGDKKLAVGAGGIVLGALDEKKQVALLADLSPLTAPNRGGTNDLGTPVYDVDLAGRVDEERFARLQSAWRVKLLDGQRPVSRGLGAGDGLPFQKTPTKGCGSLVWQLCGGGPEIPELAGGGLVIDSMATDLPRTPPVAPERTPSVPQRTLQVAGFVDITQLRPPVTPLLETEVRQQPSDQTAERQRHALAMLSAYQGGPIDVGGQNCPHLLGYTTDGERVHAGHLTTRTLFRTPNGVEGPCDFTEEYARKPGPQPFATRVTLRHDPKRLYTWGIGQGKGTDEGMFVWEAESFLTQPLGGGDPPPFTPPGGVQVIPGNGTPVGPNGGPGPVRGPLRGANPKPPVILLDPTGQSGIGGYAPGRVIYEPRAPKPEPSTKPGTFGPVTSQDELVSEIERWFSGTPPLPPLADDTISSKPGTGVMAGPLYTPGVCLVLPEQGKNRVAVGEGEIKDRPEVGGIIPVGAHDQNTGTPVLQPDPCKKNRRVASKAGVAIVPPCYTQADLDAKRETTGDSVYQVILPPGVTELALVHRTPSGGSVEGFVLGVSADGELLTVRGRDSAGDTTGGLQVEQDGTISSVDAAGTPTPIGSGGAATGGYMLGQPGYGESGFFGPDQPYGDFGFMGVYDKGSYLTSVTTTRGSAANGGSLSGRYGEVVHIVASTNPGAGNNTDIFDCYWSGGKPLIGDVGPDGWLVRFRINSLTSEGATLEFRWSVRDPTVSTSTYILLRTDTYSADTAGYVDLTLSQSDLATTGKLLAGDAFELQLEVEVTVASGSGAGTCFIDFGGMSLDCTG